MIYLLGTVLRNYSAVVALLLRLRQACDHPFLAINSLVRSKKSVFETEVLQTLNQLNGISFSYQSDCLQDILARKLKLKL